MPDVVIVGAGIAGLTAGWALARMGVDVRVLEQRSRIGGVIVTDKVNGFVVDGGPDSLLVQKPAGVELCRELGIADRLVPTRPPRTAFVVRHGRLVPLPEGSFLGLPTRLRPYISTPLFSWPAKVRMALEPLLPRRRSTGDESIGQFVRRRFGDEARTYIAEPLLAGIHAGDVDRLSLHALFPRLAVTETEHGSVLQGLRRVRPTTSAEGAFVSFPGGMGELTDALAASLAGAILLNARVEEVSGRGPFRVRLASGEHLDARSIVLATPAWMTAALLKDVDRQLASLCGSVPYVSSGTVVFALRRDQVARPLDGSGYVVPAVERRTVMAATWITSKWPHRAPPDWVLVRGFVGGAHDADILDRSDDEIARSAFEDLARMMEISGAPALTRVYRWRQANAQYHVGHLDLVQQIDDRLQQLPGVFLTGSGYRGTGIPDCIADARATAEGVAQFLGSG